MTMKKTLILSIACGALAIILSALYLHIKEVEVAGGGELREVLVAAVDIKPHTLMEPGLVRIKKIPLAFIQPGVLSDVREVRGRVSIALIQRGEQVVGTKLVTGGPKIGLSFKVPKGKRAVSISVNEADCAGGLIQPDDYVDIIVTFDYGDDDNADKYTYTLFQGTPVLAVGSETYSPRNPEGIAVVEKKSKGMFGSAPSISSAGGKGKVVTFALDPDDAQKLIFADETGSITLALRSPMDGSIYGEVRPVKIDTLTGKAGFTRKNYREYRGK